VGASDGENLREHGFGEDGYEGQADETATARRPREYRRARIKVYVAIGGVFVAWLLTSFCNEASCPVFLGGENQCFR
jgi:hypothetical protein